MSPSPEGRVLRPEDYARAATALGCEVAAIQAVAEVEGGRWGAFLEDGSPVILVERHLFHRLTGGKYDDVAPDISSPVPGGYGRISEQPARLALAASFDRAAALKATSWGLFQILGLNHANCGFPVLQDFINAMYESAGRHLDVFVALARSFRLEEALRTHDWHTFKVRYNGPAANDYEAKIKAAYARLKGN